MVKTMFLVLNVMVDYIIVLNMQEKEITIDKNILNLEDGKFTEFGVQIGGKIQI